MAGACILLLAKGERSKLTKGVRDGVTDMGVANGPAGCGIPDERLAARLGMKLSSGDQRWGPGVVAADPSRKPSSKRLVQPSSVCLEEVSNVVQLEE